MSMRKTGSWDKANNFFKDLEKKGKIAASQTLKQIGLKGEQIVVDHLQKQDLGWKPLSPRYKLQKLKGGDSNSKKSKSKKVKKSNFSEKTLIRTSTLFNSITTFSANKVAYVGVAKNKEYDNGQSVANIMAVHEYGSAVKNIPARPLFKPSREELKKWCENNPTLAKAFLSEVSNLGIDNV